MSPIWQLLWLFPFHMYILWVYLSVFFLDTEPIIIICQAPQLDNTIALKCDLYCNLIVVIVPTHTHQSHFLINCQFQQPMYVFVGDTVPWNVYDSVLIYCCDSFFPNAILMLSNVLLCIHMYDDTKRSPKNESFIGKQNCVFVYELRKLKFLYKYYFTQDNPIDKIELLLNVF